MDTIFLLAAALITLIALDFGEAGACAVRSTPGRRNPACPCFFVTFRAPLSQGRPQIRPPQSW